MDVMSPLDALFLHMEDGVSHMHIGSCAVFEGPPPGIDELARLIESKLPQLKCYRQKVRFVPGMLGHPVWVDDAHFNLGFHLRHSALPPPGSQTDLENLMGRLMSQELDRHRPLWEAWMIEGLADERWALISKVHHCMVDGISGTDLMALLLDADRDAATGTIAAWVSEHEPSDAQLALTAMAHMVLEPARAVLDRRLWRLNPTAAWKELSTLAGGAGSLAMRLLSPVRPVSIEGHIGPHRRWAVGRCRLADAKAIRAALGGSVNDVVLAAITGAFRSVLIERGDPVDEGVVLHSLVPVSVRPANDHTPNNQVSLIVAELPVGVADPVARLHSVSAQMARLKSSHQVDAGAAVVAGARLVPPALFALVARSTMSAVRRMPQPFLNTITTNVPGPQQPLYALGREMVEYLPFVPISEGIRVGVAILSYNGRLSFGVTGDYDGAPDIGFMAGQIESEMAVLRRRATKARRP
jgi:diacylglycerol O-acyltransferase / wax synthase